MRILLDECLRRRLRDSLASPERVPEAGWAGVKNGELLAVAENAAFQLFLTIDRGIEHQQNLAARRSSLNQVTSNRLADFVPEILRVLVSLEPGQIVKIGPGTNS